MKTFQIKYINGSNTRFTYSSNIFIHVSAVNLVTIRTWVSWIPLLMDKDKSVLCTCVKAVAPFCGFRHRLSVSHVWEEVPVRRVLTVWLHSRLYHCSRTWTQVFSLLLNNTIILQQYLFPSVNLVLERFLFLWCRIFNDNFVALQFWMRTWWWKQYLSRGWSRDEFHVR